MDVLLPFVLIMLFAAFVGGMAGFGGALVSMPLLIPLVGLDVARPVFALAFIAQGMTMIYSYRKSITLRAIWRIMLSSVLSIPLGIFLVQWMPRTWTLGILGGVLVGYSLYNLFGLSSPRLRHRWWAVPFGMASGILSGAFNTSGPPLIVYADAKQWERATFKGNLQSIFFANNVVTNISHFAVGNHSAETIQLSLIAMVMIFVGVNVGRSMDRFINKDQFRKIVLVMLLIIGVRLLIQQFL